MDYKLEQNPDKYTWKITKSDISNGRLRDLHEKDIGPEYPGENERTIEQRARQALKLLKEAKHD